jgi:hypothetical protein
VSYLVVVFPMKIKTDLLFTEANQERSTRMQRFPHGAVALLYFALQTDLN